MESVSLCRSAGVARDPSGAGPDWKVATKKTVAHEISVYSKIEKTFTQINNFFEQTSF